jgi:hypothetical protein
MCLLIKVKNKKTFVPLQQKHGYKTVFRLDECEDAFESRYHNKRGRIGEVYKSNRRYKPMTKLERQLNVVQRGIHVYTNLSRARLDQCAYSIVKVALDPKYFVARSSYSEAVYTQVTPVGFIT